MSNYKGVFHDRHYWTADIKLYVATNGNDSWSGEIESPFATLERARNEIRKLKSEGLDAPVTVFVRDGIYELSERLKLDEQDS